MPVISVPQAFNEDELYADLEPIFGRSLFVKCEGFDFAGSAKLKAAAEMVGGRRAGCSPADEAGPGRVLVREPGGAAENDRGE